MITEQEVLMGRQDEYPLTSELLANLAHLLAALNQFRGIYGIPMRVTSGYRPGKYNTAASGARNSCHLTCEACDFADPTGALDQFCVNNQELLEVCGLYLESPVNTPGWTHLQTRAPASGKRIFLAK